LKPLKLLMLLERKHGLIRILLLNHISHKLNKRKIKIINSILMRLELELKLPIMLIDFQAIKLLPMLLLRRKPMLKLRLPERPRKLRKSDSILP